MRKNSINRIVEHDGIVHFWNGSDFLIHYKNAEYSLKRNDEWYPILVKKLIDQNHSRDLDELIKINNDLININAHSLE